MRPDRDFWTRYGADQTLDRFEMAATSISLERIGRSVMVNIEGPNGGVMLAVVGMGKTTQVRTVILDPAYGRAVQPEVDPADA